MSTNAKPTYEPTRQTGRPRTHRPDDDESWVARCQRQFESTGTDRLHNLVDRENRSMPRMD